MIEFINDRTDKYREFFELDNSANLQPRDADNLDLTDEQTHHLERFNLEWHFVPTAEAVPLDQNYLKKLYPTAHKFFAKHNEHAAKVRDQLIAGHQKQQGCIVAVETTAKPKYLPRNRQAYGTQFGHDPSLDPLAALMGRAGMTSGTRFDHNYRALRGFFELVNDDWQKRNLLPKNYRVTVCPPAIFNLVGTIFHPEWSATESLELGFYRDERGNATCFAVGANSPGDFSFVDIIEGEDEWALTGFRLALLPDSTRHDADRK